MVCKVWMSQLHIRPQISGHSTSGSANNLEREAEDSPGKQRAGEKGRDGGGGSLSVKHFCTTKQRRVSLVTRSGQTRIRAAERNQKITHQTELGSRTIWDLNPGVSEDVLGFLVT